MAKLKIAVLFGGASSEHDVSLVSAYSVLTNIPKDKYDVICIGITKNGHWMYYPGEYEDIRTGEWENNPDCCTALYDAMGISINRLHKKVTPEDNVLVTVITDGYENSSREYRQSDIKSLVERLKSEGWVFAYIGANQDVLQVGESLAIRNTLSFEATSRGTEEMSRRMSCSRERLFSCMACEEYSADAANESFFDEDDFEEKSKK